MSLIVRLSPEWERRAKQGGYERQRYAESRNLEHFGGRPMTSLRALSNHIVGCRGECAVAKVLSLPWSVQAGVLTGVDVGGKVEARTRRMPDPHGDLAFRTKDKDDLPYVLVHAHRDGQLELIGWLYGHEARARGGDWHYQICYVAPPYRDIKSLITAFGRREVAEAA